MFFLTLEIRKRKNCSLSINQLQILSWGWGPTSFTSGFRGLRKEEEKEEEEGCMSDFALRWGEGGCPHLSKVVMERGTYKEGENCNKLQMAFVLAGVLEKKAVATNSASWTAWRPPSPPSGLFIGQVEWDSATSENNLFMRTWRIYYRKMLLAIRTGRFWNILPR